MKCRLLPLAAALLLASPLSLAAAGDMQGGMHDCPMHHAGATEADHARHRDAMFAMLDADKNGTIDRAEFDKHHEQMRRQHAGQAGQQAPAAAPAAPAPEAKPEDEHAAHH